MEVFAIRNLAPLGGSRFRYLEWNDIQASMQLFAP